MALSPADYYAYSRATGAPVPQDPRERAEMAPDVLEFRRNQLKTSQQQESNPVATGIGIGLALAGGLGAALGARRLLRGPKQAANAGVRQADLSQFIEQEAPVRRAAAAEPQPAPSKVAIPGQPTPEERQRVYAEVAAKPKSELQPVYRPKGSTEEDVLITDPNTGEVFISGRSPASFAERYISLRPELKGQRTDLPIARTPGTFKEFSQDISGITAANKILQDPEFLAAVKKQRIEEGAELGRESQRQSRIAKQIEQQADEVIASVREFSPREYLEQKGSLAPAAEDTLTARQQTQNPVIADQQINAVESGEDQTTGRVIKQLTIADPWGKAVVPPSVVNKQPTGIPLLPAVAASPREKAQTFLQTTFEELGSTIPGRYRRERAMGLDPDIAEAVELYASTGDPNVLNRLSKTPSSPVTVSPVVQTELKETEIPTRMFYELTNEGEFTEDLFEKDINLTNRISTLGAQKQAIINRIQEIDKLEPQLRFAAADEPGQGGYYTRMLNKLLFEKQFLNPESVNADLGDALAQRDFVRRRMESLESLGTKYKPLQRQEGVRPFFEVDPETNKIIPETLEIRSGRPSVELEEQKTGGGRYYAMYDPDSQVGSSIGIYGTEPRNYPIADPELRPTALQREETKLTLRRGEYPKFQAAVKSTPEQKLQSLDVSEALRRARIEGRDPNMILKQFGIGR